MMLPTEDAWARAVMDAVPQPLVIIDTDGAFAYANDAATESLELSDRRRLRGLSAHEILHDHRLDGSPYPSHECPIVRSGGSPLPASGREIFFGRSGRALSVAWHVSPLPQSSQRVLAFTPQKSTASRPFAPRRTGHSGPLTADDIRVQVAAQFRDPDLTPLRLAHDNHVSLRTLQAVLARTGRTPARMIRLARLEHARELLSHGQSPRTVAFACGFSDADTFTRAFRRQFGAAPREAFPSRRAIDAKTAPAEAEAVSSLSQHSVRPKGLEPLTF